MDIFLALCDERSPEISGCAAVSRLEDLTNDWREIPLEISGPLIVASPLKQPFRAC